MLKKREPTPTRNPRKYGPPRVTPKQKPTPTGTPRKYGPPRVTSKQKPTSTGTLTRNVIGAGQLGRVVKGKVYLGGSQVPMTQTQIRNANAEKLKRAEKHLKQYTAQEYSKLPRREPSVMPKRKPKSTGAPPKYGPPRVTPQSPAPKSPAPKYIQLGRGPLRPWRITPAMRKPLAVPFKHRPPRKPKS